MPNAGAKMNRRRSYLESLNTGRERRADPSIDDLSRALDKLESSFDALSARRGAEGPDRIAETQGWRERRDRDEWLDRAARMPAHGRADEQALVRARDESVAAISRIAQDLTALRQELRGDLGGSIGRQFDGLRRDLETIYKSTQNGRTDPLVAEELQRISHAVTILADRRDETGLDAIRMEIEDLKNALSGVATNDMMRSLDQRFDAFERRLDTGSMAEIDSRLAQITQALESLPDSLQIRPLEDKIRTLAGALDHFSRQQPAASPVSLTSIEDRLDEISRAIMATTVSVQATQHNPEPFERIEARISSLARQIEDSMAERSGPDLAPAFADLAERIEMLAGRSDAPAESVDRLAEQITRVAGMMERIGDGAGNADAIERIEERFADLVHMLDSRTAPGSADSAGHLAAIEQRLNDMMERFETAAAPAGNPGPSFHEAFDARFTDLADRLDRFGETVDQRVARSLDSHLGNLADRFAGTDGRIEPIDRDLVRGLEAQVAGLTRLLSEPGAASGLAADANARLDRIETALGANRDAIVQAARQAAEEAVRGAPGHPDGTAIVALADDLKALEGLARRSEERNSKTFAAIHDTLLKIVDRLGTIDNGAIREPEVRPTKRIINDAPTIAPDMELETQPVADAAPHRTAPARTPVEAAAEAAFAALSGDNVRVEEKAPRKSLLGGLAKAIGGKRQDAADMRAEPRIDAAADAEEPAAVDPALANQPLEPGSGAPDLNAIMRRVREQQSPRKDDDNDAARSDFIAAARRAAQAAAAEAETTKKRGEKPGKKRGGDLVGKLLQHKKPVLMGIGALVIALSALQLGREFLNDKPSEQAAVTKVAPAPKPEDKSDAALDTAATPPVRVVGENRDELAIDPAQAAKAGEREDTRTDLAMLAPAAPAATAASTEEPAPAVVTVPDDVGPFALVEAARNNDPKALYEVAARMVDGRAGKTDLAAAAGYFEKAAELGLAPAQYRLASMYEKGNGVERDVTKAKTWYQMAAEQGNAGAMHNLAVLHVMGAEGTPNNEEAARWFLSAGELGVKDSQFNLGILAAKGTGMPQSLEESYKWFALAAMSGDKDAAEKRDEVAKAMRPEQLAKARATTELWKATPVDPATNDVSIPESWTDKSSETAAVDMRKAVKNIQLILAKNGYDAGPADGMMGEKTRTAIIAYQKANDMAATGEVDEALIRSLLAKK